MTATLVAVALAMVAFTATIVLGAAPRGSRLEFWAAVLALTSYLLIPIAYGILS